MAWSRTGHKPFYQSMWPVPLVHIALAWMKWISQNRFHCTWTANDFLFWRYCWFYGKIHKMNIIAIFKGQCNSLLCRHTLSLEILLICGANICTLVMLNKHCLYLYHGTWVIKVRGISSRLRISYHGNDRRLLQTIRWWEHVFAIFVLDLCENVYILSQNELCDPMSRYTI